jgi:hypothetical protein
VFVVAADALNATGLLRYSQCKCSIGREEEEATTFGFYGTDRKKFNFFDKDEEGRHDERA